MCTIRMISPHNSPGKPEWVCRGPGTGQLSACFYRRDSAARSTSAAAREGPRTLPGWLLAGPATTCRLARFFARIAARTVCSTGGGWSSLEGMFGNSNSLPSLGICPTMAGDGRNGARSCVEGSVSRGRGWTCPCLTSCPEETISHPTVAPLHPIQVLRRSKFAAGVFVRKRGSLHIGNSILVYRFEYGRTYHRYKDSQSLLSSATKNPI